jgi:hypothetical protein
MEDMASLFGLRFKIAYFECFDRVGDVLALEVGHRPCITYELALEVGHRPSLIACGIVDANFFTFAGAFRIASFHARHTFFSLTMVQYRLA